MKSDYSDHDLDAMLRAKQDEALPDNGFSQRVMQALPAPRLQFAQKVGRYRVILCVAFGMAAWLFTLPSLQTAVSAYDTTQAELARMGDAFTGIWSPESIFILSALLFGIAVVFAAESREPSD